MAMVDGGILTIKPGLQLQLQLQFAPDDHPINNKKNKESSKFQIPKSASISNWKSRCDFCKVRCSSSPSSSSSSYPPELKFMRHFSPNLVEDFFSLYPDGDNVFDKFPSHRQTLFITVVVDDENGQLRHKMDDLVAKKDYLSDVRKRVDIVMDEVVPLLLENANRWISSRLVVQASPGSREAAGAILSEDIQDASLIRYSSKRNRCTKVLLEVAIVDAIDDKFIEIHTRDDLVAFFQHLMCREGISSAFAVCVISLIFKEKTQAFEHYTQAPRGNQAEANKDGQSPLTMKILKYLITSLSFLSNLL